MSCFPVCFCVHIIRMSLCMCSQKPTEKCEMDNLGLGNPASAASKVSPSTTTDIRPCPVGCDVILYPLTQRSSLLAPEKDPSFRSRTFLLFLPPLSQRVLFKSCLLSDSNWWATFSSSILSFSCSSWPSSTNWRHLCATDPFKTHENKLDIPTDR